jgi:hypothetical protein
MNKTIIAGSGDFTVINNEMPLGGHHMIMAMHKVRDSSKLSCKGAFDPSHEGIVFRGTESDAYRRIVNKGSLKLKKVKK